METKQSPNRSAPGFLLAPVWLLRKVYMFWAGAVWFLSFLCLYPFFCLCIAVPSFQRAMPFLNQLWCRVFFPLSFLRVVTRGKKHLHHRGPVVYVANHGSFLDIAHLTYILPGFPAFMGKASLGRLPVFGFFFRNLHVVVERGSQQGRIKALKDSRRLLETGRSLVVFPEGSIHSKIQPGLAPFKDGAFRLAIESAVPVVPVTLCYNWYVLPDDGRWLPNFYFCKAVVHEPLDPAAFPPDDPGYLRDRVWEQIARTLQQENYPLTGRPPDQASEPAKAEESQAT